MTGDGETALQMALLDGPNIWQRYGQACVVCGRKFDHTEYPEVVERVGGDPRVVYRCSPRCPPLSPRQCYQGEAPS